MNSIDIIKNYLRPRYYELRLMKYYDYNLNKSIQKKYHLCYMADGHRRCGGLTDRLKGMITLKTLCEEYNLEYKIFHTHPFPLTDYLVPNKYNWKIDFNDLEYNLHNSRPFYLTSSRRKRIQILAKKSNLHVYCHDDLLNNQNWGQIFKEMFTPSYLLQKGIDKHKCILGDEYIAVLFRFVNLLGDFKQYSSKELDQRGKESIIDSCFRELLKIKETHTNIPILVCSDSITFLEKTLTIKDIYFIPGKIVHMDDTNCSDFNLHLKSFLDFFLLSMSKKIYSIRTKQMYLSAMPDYAAKINNIPCERILI